MNVHVHPIYDRLEFINTHTWFTITSDIYEVFMNQEKSFQEVLFTHKSLSYLLVYLLYECFMNETHYLVVFRKVLIGKNHDLDLGDGDK